PYTTLFRSWSRTSSREPARNSPRMRGMNGFHSGNAAKSVRCCHTRSACALISISVRSSFMESSDGGVRLPQEASGLQFLRDLLDGLLDVLRFAGAGAHELAAAEQEDDDLRFVDPIHEARELFRLVLNFLQPQGDRDRVQVDLRAEVRRSDDVLDLDL